MAKEKDVKPVAVLTEWEVFGIKGYNIPEDNKHIVAKVKGDNIKATIKKVYIRDGKFMSKNIKIATDNGEEDCILGDMNSKYSDFLKTNSKDLFISYFKV